MDRAPHVTLVLGPPGSGKTSLIASSIVDLARCGREESGEVPTVSSRAEAVSAARCGSVWLRHELRPLDTMEQADRLAVELWQSWHQNWYDGAPLPTQPPSLMATMINPSFLQLRGPSRLVVEVSATLLVRFLGRASSTRGLDPDFDAERLDWMLGAADAIVLCAPCRTVPAVEFAEAARRVIEIAIARASRPSMTLAWTLADIELTSLELSGRRAISQVMIAAGRADLAREWFKASKVWRSIWDTAEESGRLEICSSYGVLARSGTPNVDLAAATEPALAGRRQGPLWPDPSMDLSMLVPSTPRHLAFWYPIGVRPCIWGVANQSRELAGNGKR